MTTQQVHVKAQYNNEFRRFHLETLSIAYLEQTLEDLFRVGAPFSIKYQDEENDWVFFCTDKELAYAAEITTKPLRLMVEAKEKSTIPPQETIPAKTETREEKKAYKKCGGINREEVLSNKLERISSRIEEIRSRMNSDISNDQARALTWRLKKLEGKLAFVQKKRDAFQAQPQTPESPSDESPCDTLEGPWRHRGCGRGRGGRGGRGHRGGHGFDHAPHGFGPGPHTEYPLPPEFEFGNDAFHHGPHGFGHGPHRGGLHGFGRGFDDRHHRRHGDKPMSPIKQCKNAIRTAHQNNDTEAIAANELLLQTLIKQKIAYKQKLSELRNAKKEAGHYWKDARKAPNTDAALLQQLEQDFFAASAALMRFKANVQEERA
jgi:chaperonin cofactor prefoldin